MHNSPFFHSFFSLPLRLLQKFPQKNNFTESYIAEMKYRQQKTYCLFPRFSPLKQNFISETHLNKKEPTDTLKPVSFFGDTILIPSDVFKNAVIKTIAKLQVHLFIINFTNIKVTLQIY